MQKYFLSLLAGLLCSLAGLAQTPSYKAYINLTAAQEDQLPVGIKLPPSTKDTVEYRMPKIVPGTYAIYDFGRFVTRFHAYTASGDTLPVQKLSENRWQITNATQLDSIGYWVEDSYDTDKSNVIFEPAGTNIEAGKDYVLNTFGFVGYLEGKRSLPYTLAIEKPTGFYGVTALSNTNRGENTDTYQADSYMSLTDSPLMYSVPDTASVKMGGAKIQLGVYAPHNHHLAPFVLEQLKRILHAQEAYLGGQLPIKQYAFIIYLFDGMSLSGAYGALEHSYSSMYFLPVMDSLSLAKTIRDVSAHEFFHIVTPLSIHAEQIGNFDYINPKMSEHLWLYEGVTEYAAGLCQVKDSIMSESEYLGELRDKIVSSKTQYNDSLPFTVMSKGCLDQYADQYQNVYEKGALIAMSLDLELLKLSDGNYHLQDLIQDLSKKYGKDHAFKDDELFGVIESLTYPETGDFLRKYVSGPNPLPLKKVLNYAGVDYYPEKEIKTITMGNFTPGYDKETKRIRIEDASDLNHFGQKIGLKEGDEFVSVNGMSFDLPNLKETITRYKAETKPGSKVKFVIMRKDEKGEWKEKTLKAKAELVSSTKPFILEMNENPTAEQLKIRKAWLHQY